MNFEVERTGFLQGAPKKEKAKAFVRAPLVDTHSRFLRIATYGDMQDIHTSIPEWWEKSFFAALPRDSRGRSHHEVR